MPKEPPCIARPMFQIFEMLKQGKISFKLELSDLVPHKRTVCKDNEKAIIITTGLMITGQKNLKDYLELTLLLSAPIEMPSVY